MYVWKHECVHEQNKEACALQVDCDFSIRLVHASAADLDLERLRGSEVKKPGAARYAYLMRCKLHVFVPCLLWNGVRDWRYKKWASSCFVVVMRRV